MRAVIMAALLALAPACALAHVEHDPLPRRVAAHELVYQEPPEAIDALARVTYCEARGEGRIGMRAVAHVVVNRVEDARWADDVLGVLRQPAQFECWELLDELRYRGEAWAVAQEEARLALAGVTRDPTRGATHYHASWMTPRWARSLPLLARIGHHIFYA